MSLTRRLAVGLPAAGVTAFAALAFAGSPALAADAAVRPVATATPDGYGGAAPTSTADDHTPGSGYGNGSAHGSGNTGGGANTGGGGHRGNAGYGGVSPSTSPTPVPSTSTPTGNTDTVPPTGNTDTVPPGGVSPTTASPSTPTGGGVSPAGTLPLTGAPMGVTLTLGALLVASGAGAIWYSRRRRNA